MPNGKEPLKFPVFPTQFTEQDVKRLRELEEQKKKMEEIYQARFTPEQWAKVPLPEKAVRKLLPQWLSPVARVVTPWEWGWEFGFTPEQAQEQRFKVEEEYKELVRKEKITRLLADIQADLMIAALAGEPISDITELLADFPELRTDFTEEEVSYITTLAQNILRASPEDILTGKIFAYEPSQLPITPEDIEELAKETPRIDPRFILSTVAFSKNLEDIRAALQEAYPPQVEEAEVAEGVRQKLLDYFKQRNIELGIIPKEGESIKDTIKKAHEKIAEEEGGLLTLINEQTGEMVAARRKSDNTVWVGEELIGFYDEKQGKVVPLSISTGQPLLTEEAQESQLKDLWDSFYLGIQQAWYGTKQALFGIIPQELLRMYPEEEVEPEISKAIRRWQEGAVAFLQERQDQREFEFQEWLKEHPDLIPRPEYIQNPLEHTELFKDPYFYAYTIISNAPIIGAALLVGIATTLATKNPWAGAVAGAAVITPVQINSVYEDLIANGASLDNATMLATSVGTLMGAVEILPGMIVLKAVSPTFMRLFRQNLQKELTKRVVTRLSALGILRTAGTIEVAEVLEEIVQEAMQNAAVKTVNENRSILENLPQTAINTAIAVAPLAIFGGGAEYLNMKANLPPKIQEEIDTTAKKMEDAGLTPDLAEAVAVSKVMETETGQAEVELATEKADGQVPSPEVKPEKVKALETKLKTVNEDVSTFTDSVVVQESILYKLKTTGTPWDVSEQVEKVTGLKENLKELEDKRATLEKQLKKLRKPVVPPTVPEVTPEAVPEPIAEIPVAPEEGARNVTVEGRPRIQDWEDEQDSVRVGLEGNPTIAKAIEIGKTLREARERTERTLEGLHLRLEEAGTAEEKKLIEDELKGISKEAGFSSKTLLAKHWGDLTPPEQAALALIAIPDRSIHFPVSKELFDMRYYMQFLQEETGLPFYEVFKRAELSHGAARIVQEKFLTRIGTDPNFTHIRTDEAALARVAQEINSRNPTLKVESPEGLTDQELLLANVIEGMYQEYQNKVRYLRVMRTTGTMEALKAEFPDAPEVELALVKELRDVGNLDDLWLFLQNLEWGVIGSGYDPWMVSYPQLVPTRVRIGTTRGAARLMRRESIEFPEIKMERNVLLRLATYLKQVEAQWRIEPELDVLEDLWSKAGVKFSNLGQVESALREWTRELQGIPTRQSFLDSVLRRVWRQAMSAVFLHPWMPFRNFHQHMAFHPDRGELVRGMLRITPMPADMKVKSGIYFDAFVSQLKGIRRDWLYMGERGLPGLGWLTRLSDRASLYAHSDNIPRRWSFEVSTNKARRATEQYLKDKDIKKWLRDSGANHLRQTERNYALQLLAQEKFDLAVPGLREVSGAEMVSFYIGHEVANMTHFIYERAFRAPVELGATGRTLYNLIVFPRGYFQRMYLQAQKVFGKETTWEQAKAGFKDITLIIIVGVIISEWLRKVTGRPRRAYNPADIVQWQLGGLIIGVGMDLTKLISDLIVALDPTVDPEFKRDVLARLPGELIRQTDVLVPFYRNFIDSIEAATDTRNIDVQLLRKLRALLDESYTPEEIETIDRNLWEKIRKAVLAGEPPDPTAFQQIQVDLQEAQVRLGEMDAVGRFYTLRQFAGDIRTLTKPLPDDMLTEEYNFSELVIFYKESEDKWKELYKFPSSPASVRKEWRESHIEEEAMLLFWGMYSVSVFGEGTPEWREVSNLLRTWFSLYEVDKRMHAEWADWTLPRT